MKFSLGLRMKAAVVSVLMFISSTQAAVSVVNPRCEYLPTALGVDTNIPRFSWQLYEDIPTRGQKQTAYQILVASSLDLINSNSGDLWSSGKVNSDQSVNVEYAGSPLSSGMDCYWKVQSFDKDGASTGWSAAARFSVGLLAASDWKGSWISMSSASENDCPWFRKTFTVSEIPENAFAYIASAGFHELYVNGQKMNDSAVLNPSVSNMAKRVLYRTYDIKPYLKVGDNAIGVWLAPGWSLWPVHNGWPNFNLSKRPIFIGQVEMKSSTGAITRVVTDNTWKCRLSCLTHIGGWQFGNFGGERFNAGNDIPEWSTAELDENGWVNATTYTLSRTLSSDLVPPNRKCAVIEAASVTGSGSSCKIKMKDVYTGWIEVKLKGNPGSTARITINLDGGSGAAMGAQDEYIFDNSGEGTFCNRFNYHEILYVNISGISATPATSDIKGYRISNDLTRTGSFNCSNSLIKKEYDITLNTCVNLAASGQTVDCPHRERLGYGGDGQGLMQVIMLNYEAGAFYSKWARDWGDQQLASGELPNTAPASNGGGGPAWGSFAVLMPWQVYQTYGDKRILDANYSTMKNWLAFLDNNDDANSILQPYYPISGWFFLGDHASPSGNGGTDGVLVFNSCNYLYQTRIMSQIAEVLGKTSESQTYAAKADAIRAGINAQFYNSTNHNYVDTRQIDYAFPLLAGAVPDADIAAVQTNLQNAITSTSRGHIDAGMLGTTYMVRYLIDVDRSDLIYTMATVSGAPGWADLIQRGFTSWPGETWTSPFTESPIHATYVGIGPWFQQGICGIRSDTTNTGFKQCIIKPAVVGDLTSASGQIGTMYGIISSDWSKNGNTFTHEIKVPANTIATYFFPDDVVDNIKEGYVAAQEATGVEYLTEESGYSVFQVQSGNYRFTNGPVGIASGNMKNKKILFKLKRDCWLIHIPLLTPAIVSVYNMAGRRVAVKSKGKGKQRVEIARPGAAGCYYVQIVAPGITLSRKVMVVR